MFSDRQSKLKPCQGSAAATPSRLLQHQCCRCPLLDVQELESSQFSHQKSVLAPWDHLDKVALWDNPNPRGVRSLVPSHSNK